MTRMSTKNRKFHQETRIGKLQAKHSLERYHLTNALARIVQMKSSRSNDGRKAAAIAQEALDKVRA